MYWISAPNHTDARKEARKKFHLFISDDPDLKISTHLFDCDS